MNQSSTFAVSFYLRNDKIDSKKTAPIFMRITINGKRAEISTNRRIDITKWHNGTIISNTRDVKQLSDYLHTLKSKIYDIHRNLLDRNEIITSQKIKDAFLSKSLKFKTLLEIFDIHNNQLKQLIGKDYVYATYERYKTTKKHVCDFLNSVYKKDDIIIQDINYSFITDFERFLKTQKNISHNTTVKYIRYFKKIILMAIKNDWLEKDPFKNYSIKLKEVKRGYLTTEELYILENKEIKIERLRCVRDIFVFSCYTGLAYIDVAKLSKEHLYNGIDNETWIKLYRTKTDSQSLIPILPKAQKILDFYKDNNINTLLPIISNQKMNSYLKELADICAIEKNLTFHLARHTFATTVTLTNGVSMESVSGMLGHKNLKTTQIYSKITEQKIGNDMAQLKNKLL